MAEKLVKTGYANGDSSKPIKLYVTYSYTQDAEKNQTTITCGMYVQTPSSVYSIGPWTDFDGSYVGKSSLTFDGDIPNFAGKRTLVTGKKFIVTHNDAGEATATISWQWGVRSSWGGYNSGTNKGSFTIDLPDIHRKATLITAPNFNDEGNPTITYSNPAGSAVDSLDVAIHNSEGNQSYVPYRAVSLTGNSYTFNLTSSERRNLLVACANSKGALPIRFYLRTKIGNSTYYSYLDREMSVVNADPIVTASVVDVNTVTIGLTGNPQKLIKYYSNAKATMTAEPQKYATIDPRDCITESGGYSVYGSEYTFHEAENNVFTFTAKDSRENVTTETLTPEMVDYVKLTCNIDNDIPDALGHMTIGCYGSYYNGSFGAVENTLTAQYRYKVYGGTYGDWQDMTVTVTGNGYYASADFTITDFVQGQLYTFQTRATDKLDTVPSTEATVKSIPVFHWGENDFVFEVPVTFNAGVNISLEDQGTWLPAIGYVTSYTTRIGWYQKTGQIVTVGFFIKASVSAGFHTTRLSITGLPFTPACSAAGGGMCSGAYVSAGFNFQCFVAETSGDITARVQQCNNTADSILGTSASGCFYRYGGGEMTLSGTITFMTDE